MPQKCQNIYWLLNKMRFWDSAKPVSAWLSQDGREPHCASSTDSKKTVFFSHNYCYNTAYAIRYPPVADFCLADTRYEIRKW